MRGKEVLRETYEYKDRDYVIRVQFAETDNTKYVPIIDWPQKGYSTVGSCTANYIGNTPEEALLKGKEVIHTVVDGLGLKKL